MSIEKLLDHTCDIYHIAKSSKSPGYNLANSPSFSYSDTPDKKEVKCHFSVVSDSITIVQKEPYNDMDARIKLVLPIDTDIRLNDKIVDCFSGLSYTASVPRRIRGHHIFVYIQRLAGQRAL